MVIVVHVWLRSRPEHRDETVEALRQMRRSTVDNDDGCLRYDFACDIDDECVFTCIEEWRDAESLRAHLGAAHMKQPDAVLERTTVGKAEIRVFHAEETGIPTPG